MKKRFRNEIKQQTLDYLNFQLRTSLAKLKYNKVSITRIAKEQNVLKKEVSELYRMVEEYKK